MANLKYDWSMNGTGARAIPPDEVNFILLLTNTGLFTRMWENMDAIIQLKKY